MKHTRRNILKLSAGAAALTVAPLPAAASGPAREVFTAVPAGAVSAVRVRVVSASGKMRVYNLPVSAIIEDATTS